MSEKSLNFYVRHKLTMPYFMGEMTGIWKSEVASRGTSYNSKGIAVWGGDTPIIKIC